MMLNWLFILRAWLVFSLLVAPAGILIIVLPSRPRRRRFARQTARLAFMLGGMPLSVTGMENLPKRCIVVSNHSSDLDGVVLTAVLPPRFTYVIKRELLSIWISGFFLRRLGAEFVNRFNPAMAATQARRLIKIAQNGDCLGFFPEGALHVGPGLKEFKLGAFLIASRAALPVVPIIIQGTADILPRASLCPRRRPISVRVGQPIWPSGASRADARALAQHARAYMVGCIELKNSGNETMT